MTLLALSILFAQQTDPANLTLDDAVRIAERNSFSVESGIAQLLKLRARIDEVKGGIFPKFNLGANYTLADQRIFFSPSANGGGGGGGVVGNKSETQGTASFTLPIDISGAVRYGLKAADAYVKAQLYTIDANRNDVARDARKAYYRVLQAQEQVAVNAQAVTEAQLSLKNAQLEFDQGVIAKVDVLRFQAQLAQAQSDVITAQNTLDLAQESFNNTLARPIHTPFTLTPITGTPQLKADEAAINNTALTKRPEILGLQQTAIALNQITKVTSLGNAPSLSISATHTHTFQPAFTPNSSTIGVVAITWPVFDGGITRARTKEAQQDEAILNITLRQTQLGISLEVSQAITNLNNAFARLQVATDQLTYAQEAYRLALLRYQEGEAIQLEVSDAETVLTRARTGQVSARYDYLSAWADLQRAVGGDLAPYIQVGGTK